MAIKVEKNNITINQVEITKNEICKIEGDCIVPDIKPDVINLIATSGILIINKKEISEGKVRIDGSIITYIMYKGNDGNNTSARSVNHILDFSQIINVENANSDMKDIGNITLLNMEGKVINERKISIKAEVKFNIKLQNKCNIEYVEGINVENLQKLETSGNINCIVGIGNTKTSVNETIKIDGDEKLAEILRVCSNISNIETKISYNKVLVKSDIIVSILYSTENGLCHFTQAKYPIMGFIEMKDITENCIVDPVIQINNFLISSNGSQDNLIDLEIEVDIVAVVYNSKKINIIEDMYCPNKNLKISKKNVRFLNSYSENKEIYNFSQKEMLDIGEEKIYDTNLFVTIEKTIISNEYLTIVGNVKCEIIHSSDKMSGIEKKLYNMPYEYKMKCNGIKKEDRIEMNYVIKSQSINMINRGEIEVKADIEFLINNTNIQNIEFIESVEEAEKRNNNKYNVVIYYTKKGDKLWNIAKEFGSTKNEIIEENKLEGEMLKPGMQLFITK